MKLKYFSMMLSVIGIIILYMISRFSQAPIIKISDMKDYEDKIEEAFRQLDIDIEDH